MKLIMALRSRWLVTLGGCAGIVALLAPTLVSAAPSFMLHANEGNRQRRFDIDTIGAPPLLEDVFVERASAEEAGGNLVTTGQFRDMNGMVCPFPDGSGRFVNGEDTGQPNPPPGWGIFDASGTQVGKLTANYFVPQGEPYGCGFNQDGILFTSEVGFQGFGDANGQLIMWFPPYDVFPGPPGVYPNTNAMSTNFCKLATDLGTAGGVAVDGEGRVYVAASSSLSIYRFSPPFPTAPNAGGGCGSVDALGAPMADSVNRETFAVGSTFTGLAMAPNGNLYAASIVTGEIHEYDPDGNLVRKILDPPGAVPPFATGTPQGLTVGPDGTVYYADLDLIGTFPDLGPGADGKVWQIRFDSLGDPMAPEIIRGGLAFPDGLGIIPGDLEPREWRTFAGGPQRQFFNYAETNVTAANVDDLTVKWSVPTGKIITASPTVARVDVPGEGKIAVAYVQSWDANLYAIRVRDGSLLWTFATVDRVGVSFPSTASVHIENVGGQERVYVGNGQTMYCIDAITGQEIWHFDAGTGCDPPPGLCGYSSERNQIESSAIVADGKVFFGMDVNDQAGGKGGFYALDADDGRLVWFFDLESGDTCRPFLADDIRRYDPYHTELELGLPAGFLSTRPGCDHPRNPNGCGNVWSSPAYDEDRGFLYTASSNCDTDNDPMTDEPPPPMPPYDEALFALDLDGNPQWVWRPREVDNDDLAFGAAPNLFTAVIDDVEREVVGVGNKDGTYYLLDRDGENEVSGVAWDDVDPSALPYWSTNVVPGGPIGGMPATAAVDEVYGRIYVGTAPGFDPLNPQRPTVHALDASTGAILWENDAEVNADATYAPTSAFPGVAFAGGVIGGTLRSYDVTNGDKLASNNIGLALASGPAVIDGIVIRGGGIGARTGDPMDLSEISAGIPHAVTGLCVPGTPACATDVPIGGRTLKLHDRSTSGNKSRVRFVSRDAAITMPTPGGSADPTLVGASLQVINTVSGESAEYVLPIGGWRSSGSGFRFSGGRIDNFCKSAKIKNGRLGANCRGDAPGFTLDEPTQDAMVVAFKLGNEVVYCARFGGTVMRDVGSSVTLSDGFFTAKNAVAPATCPLP
jgi:outer membrane protein assembly factor BamB